MCCFCKTKSIEPTTCIPMGAFGFDFTTKTFFNVREWIVVRFKNLQRNREMGIWTEALNNRKHVNLSRKLPLLRVRCKRWPNVAYRFYSNVSRMEMLVREHAIHRKRNWYCWIFIKKKEKSEFWINKWLLLLDGARLPLYDRLFFHRVVEVSFHGK